MNRGLFILLCLIGALSFHSTQAQVARQEGIVRKITHSASDPVVPIAGVQVVVDGVSSPKSDKQGNLTITIRRNEESSYYLDDIRLPAGEVPYLLAYPSREKKLFLSPNELYIALISPEEKATVSKKIYTDLWRQYRRQGNDLIALRNELEEVQMALNSADGMGYAVRDSQTMNMKMMYVALYSKSQHAIYRMAIPYQGLESYAMTLLPVAQGMFVD